MARAKKAVGSRARRSRAEGSREARAEAILSRMRKARGYIFPAWEALVRADPDFAEKYNLFYEACTREGEGLGALEREYVVMGILAFRGSEEGLKAHIRRVYRLGGTRQAVIEAFEAASLPGGAPCLLRGLNALLAVEGEKGAAQP